MPWGLVSYKCEGPSCSHLYSRPPFKSDLATIVARSPGPSSFISAPKVDLKIVDFVDKKLFSVFAGRKSSQRALR